MLDILYMNTDSVDSFGAYLRFIRKNRNISLRELADRIGMDSGSLSKIEADWKPPPIDGQSMEDIRIALGLEYAGVVHLTLVRWAVTYFEPKVPQGLHEYVNKLTS